MERPLIGSAVLMLLVGCLAGIAFTLPLAQRERITPAPAQAGTGIAGCASKRTGQVRLLSMSGRRVGNRRPRRCRRTEVAVRWSVAGTQGPVGPQGPQGPQGPPGTPVDPSTTVLNQSAQAQPGSLYLDGQLRTTGGLRLGSETGTTLAPLYPAGSPGLVVRPIGGGALGSTLARVGARSVIVSNQDNLFLGSGGSATTFSCLLIRSGGVVVATTAFLIPGSAQSLMFDGATVHIDVLSIRCAFASVDGEQTDLVLSRPDVSSDWQGFLTTTTNQ